MIIFALLLKRGLNQSSGSANGPMLKKATINIGALKYQGVASFLTSGASQSLHLIAVSSFSNPQNAHFFILV
jgi:hypothetical protein